MSLSRKDGSPQPKRASLDGRLWPWVLVVFALILFVGGLIYQRSGFGTLGVGHRLTTFEFWEEKQTGAELRIKVAVQFPALVFSSLPWLDAPTPQFVHISVTYAEQLDKTYRVTVELNPENRIRFVDSDGNLVVPQLALAPGDEPPAPLTVYVVPAEVAEREQQVSISITSEPELNVTPIEEPYIALEGKTNAFVRRLLRTIFGDIALPIGLLTFLVGLSWNVLERQYREMDRVRELNRQIEQQLQHIEAISHDDLVQAVREIAKLEISAISSNMRIIYIRQVTSIWFRPWERELLKQIDRCLISGNESEVESLLATGESFASLQKQNKKSDDLEFVVQSIDWKKLHDLYRKLYKPPYSVELEELQQVMEGLWKEFDVDARELIVWLLVRWSDSTGGRPQVQTRLESREDLRRLGHHPVLSQRFPDLTSRERYEWPELFTSPPSLPPGVREWLKQHGFEVSPLHPGRAEMEPNLAKHYYIPEDTREQLLSESSTWVYAPRGGGRTALGLYLVHELRERDTVFPLGLRWSPPRDTGCQGAESEEDSFDPVSLLIEGLGELWLAILRRHPEALLDLRQAQQRQVSILLHRTIGTADEISLALEPSFRATNGEDDKTKKSRLLRERIQIYLREIALSAECSSSTRMGLLGLRPAGLIATYVIMELDRELPEATCRRLMYMSDALQRHQVYLKIIALQRSPVHFAAVDLQWSDQDLRSMLEKKDVEKLFSQVNAQEVLGRLVKQANGLPRKLMLLGQLALEEHIRHNPEQSTIELEDVVNALAAYDRRFG